MSFMRQTQNILKHVTRYSKTQGQIAKVSTSFEIFVNNVIRRE